MRLYQLSGDELLTDRSMLAVAIKQAIEDDAELKSPLMADLLCIVSGGCSRCCDSIAETAEFEDYLIRNPDQL